VNRAGWVNMGVSLSVIVMGGKAEFVHCGSCVSHRCCGRPTLVLIAQVFHHLAGLGSSWVKSIGVV
jgi:hypothetical protein